MDESVQEGYAAVDMYMYEGLSQFSYPLECSYI